MQYYKTRLVRGDLPRNNRVNNTIKSCSGAIWKYYVGRPKYSLNISENRPLWLTRSQIYTTINSTSTILNSGLLSDIKRRTRSSLIPIAIPATNHHMPFTTAVYAFVPQDVDLSSSLSRAKTLRALTDVSPHLPDPKSSRTSLLFI